MPLRALLYRRPVEPQAIEIVFDGSIYLVHLRRHRQARRYTLRINAAKREVILTIPPRGSLKEATPFTDGTTVPLRGVLYRIEHRPGARGTVWTETTADGEPILCVAGAA